jgi:tripartite-type tricarboxylate transporter receptor subunit TctC
MFMRAFALLVLSAVVVASNAEAQSYPSRPIRLMIGTGPGGPNTVMSRKIGDRLEARLGQPVVLDYRPGAGGIIAAQAVVRADPDGHTLYSATGALTVQRIFNRELAFDIQKDLAPVAKFTETIAALVSDARIPAATLPEFIAYARANPGKLNYGTVIGTGLLAVRNLERITGIQMVGVQYKSAAEWTAALLAGEIQLVIDAPAAHVGHAQAGKVRMLAVTSRMRAPAFPDVPTVIESVPAWEYSQWNGVLAPARTPRPVIERLSREIVAYAGSAEFRDEMDALYKGGYFPSPASADELAATIARDLKMWEGIARAAKIIP